MTSSGASDVALTWSWSPGSGEARTAIVISPAGRRTGHPSSPTLNAAPGTRVARQPRVISAQLRSRPGERLDGGRALVPGPRAVRPDDRALVALAGQQDDVARPGPLEGGLDGRAAVGDEQQVVAAPAAGGLGPAGDGVEDRLAVLATRILVGDDDQPAALPGDPAHQRSLGRVALAGRPEDRDQPAAPRRRHRGEQVEDGRQRGRAVGEVDDDAERLAERRPAPSGRAPAGPRSRPRRTAAGSSPIASPSATTASALWTLKRPASRSSSVAAPEGAV